MKLQSSTYNYPLKAHKIHFASVQLLVFDLTDHLAVLENPHLCLLLCTCVWQSCKWPVASFTHLGATRWHGLYPVYL